MTAPQFTGILAAVVTPLTADGADVDADRVERQVEHIVSGGVHGLVPGGSTGEFTALTLAERKQVIELYVAAAAGRVPVVAGTGALSTAETVELSRHAEQAGAEGVMVVPPFYDAPSWEELLAYYGAVCAAVDIPVMYYNIPAATGVDLSADRLAELARKTGVTSFKDTGGDLPKFTAVQQEHAQDITPLNGMDTLTFAALAGGGQAAVWGTASVIPQLCAQLYDALVVRCDLRAGRELWQRIFPVCQFLESHNYACAIKTGLDLVGVGAGPTRLPVLPLAPQHREEFRTLLTAAGVRVAQESAA